MLIRNGQGASEDVRRVRGELARRRAVLAQARGVSQVNGCFTFRFYVANDALV